MDKSQDFKEGTPPMYSEQDFYNWESASRDTIDFKTIYVDVTGDLIAGLLLSQIIYWHLPDNEGNRKLRVFKKGEYWLAKNREDWWDEIRITVRQYARAKKILEELGIIEVWNTMFNGFRTPHIKLNTAKLIELLNIAVRTKGTYRSGRKVLTGKDEKSLPITESTTENTTDIVSPNGESTNVDINNIFKSLSKEQREIILSLPEDKRDKVISHMNSANQDV